MVLTDEGAALWGMGVAVGRVGSELCRARDDARA